MEDDLNKLFKAVDMIRSRDLDRGVELAEIPFSNEDYLGL